MEFAQCLAVYRNHRDYHRYIVIFERRVFDSIYCFKGYGHIVPKTDLGQLTVIFYALLGVPLMLMFLANIGDAMAHIFRTAYGRGCCFFCWRKRRQNYEVNRQYILRKREEYLKAKALEHHQQQKLINN